MNNPEPNHKHFSDAELIEILYGDSSAQKVEESQSCEDCRERLQALDQVKGALPTVECPAHTTDPVRLADQIFQSHEESGEEWVRLPTKETQLSARQNVNTIWAATIILIFALGFFCGSWIPANRGSESADNSELQKFEKTWDEKLKSLESSFKASTQLASDSLEQEQLRKQLEKINQSLANMDGPHSNTTRFLRYLENKMAKIQQDQGDLRKDIQTMAINAEKEINLTRNDVQRLTEVVEYLLPVLH